MHQRTETRVCIWKTHVPEPTCQCEAFESSFPFLFVCPRYANIRSRYLLENLNNYTTRDLLQGGIIKTGIFNR